MRMYEARQNKIPISRVLSSQERKGKYIGSLAGKNLINVSSPSKSISIQKRNPLYDYMPTNVILSHGSNSDYFADKKTNAAKEKQVPDGPAWFGVDDDFISLLTTIRHSKLKGIEEGESVVFPIYRYKKKNDKNIKIAKWETWPGALEHLLYCEEKKLYKKINGAYIRNESGVEEKLPAYGGGPHQLEPNDFKELKKKGLHWQTKDAADRIFKLIPEINAYYLEKDPIISSSPEYVLNGKAMEDLDEPLRKDVTMKKIQASKYMLQYDNKIVYWKEGVKNQLIESYYNDSITINDNDELSDVISPIL